MNQTSGSDCHVIYCHRTDCTYYICNGCMGTWSKIATLIYHIYHLKRLLRIAITLCVISLFGCPLWICKLLD